MTIKFTGAEVCPKCSVAVNSHPYHDRCEDSDVEHLHITCAGCDYSWIVLPLDSPDA